MEKVVTIMIPDRACIYLVELNFDLMLVQCNLGMYVAFMPYSKWIPSGEL